MIKYYIIAILSQLLVENLIMTPRKPTRTLEDQKKIVHMNFETTKELRNAFKSKVAMNGKSVRQVLEELMKEYIKK